MYGVVGSGGGSSGDSEKRNSRRSRRAFGQYRQSSLSQSERRGQGSIIRGSHHPIHLPPKAQNTDNKIDNEINTKDPEQPESSTPEEISKKHHRRSKTSYYKRIFTAIKQAWTGVKFGSDSEEEDVEQELHYRPKDINALCQATNFSRPELQRIYRSFKDKCPTGVVTENVFKEIYCQMFPRGASASQYAHYVFCTLDKQGEGFINFADFITLLSRLSRGSLADRLCWIFSLYDLNDDGYISKAEMTEVVQAVYDLLGKTTVPVDDQAVEEKVSALFEMFDANRDGFISLEEFVETCSKDYTLVHNLDAMTTYL